MPWGRRCIQSPSFNWISDLAASERRWGFYENHSGPKIQFPELWWTVRAMLIALSPTDRQNKGWQSKSTFVTLISPVTAHLFQMGFLPLKCHSWVLTVLCGAAINTATARDEIWCNRSVLSHTAASFHSAPPAWMCSGTAGIRNKLLSLDGDVMHEYGRTNSNGIFHNV